MAVISFRVARHCSTVRRELRVIYSSSLSRLLLHHERCVGEREGGIHARQGKGEEDLTNGIREKMKDVWKESLKERKENGKHAARMMNERSSWLEWDSVLILHLKYREQITDPRTIGP